ncbi:MAG: hypothetical protein JST04_00350 [Bdellovibrionales bacterium]|nr:hypothetical protein [Bdellovibrionales bacterium]
MNRSAALVIAVASSLAGLSPGSATAGDLRPFSTDGCTKWRDGTRKHPTLWRHCCVAHDLAFWAGGTVPGRDQADRDLRDCVAATGAKREAKLIYAGVRVGSRSPRKIPGMQWGNAWDARRTRTEPLSGAEIDLLEAEILKPAYDAVVPLETRTNYLRRLRAD